VNRHSWCWEKDFKVNTFKIRNSVQLHEVRLKPHLIIGIAGPNSYIQAGELFVVVCCSLSAKGASAAEVDTENSVWIANAGFRFIVDQPPVSV
jgi:hypothetical protein